jgi:hypothetical protein
MNKTDGAEVGSEQPADSDNGAAAGRARTERSETQYPFFGLANAIEVVKAVQRAGGKEAPNADIMREMGVSKTTDRLWAYGIPGASYFGLIERIGRGEAGRIKLTDLGLQIALPGTPTEERTAKVAAIQKPELYALLLEKFAGHPVPSKDGLKNILQRDFKIVESMAPNAAEAFIDSLKVAELVSPTNSILALGDGPPPMASEKPRIAPPGETVSNEKPSPGTQTIRVPADFVIYRCKITKGHVVEIPLPPSFTKADVKRLAAFTVFLDTQADDASEEVPT